MLQWLTSNTFKKAVAFVGTIAAAGVATFPDNTIAFKVAATLAALVGVKGVLSSGLK